MLPAKLIVLVSFGLTHSRAAVVILNIAVVASLLSGLNMAITAACGDAAL